MQGTVLIRILKFADCVGHEVRYFESNGKIPAHSARPPFNSLDDDCPCALFGIVHTIGEQLMEHVSQVMMQLMQSGRRRMQGKASSQGSKHRRVLAEANCPANAQEHDDGWCYCIDGFLLLEKKFLLIHLSRHWENHANIYRLLH